MHNCQHFEIDIMKSVISHIDQKGYSNKMLYRFKDIRCWGDKAMITVVYVPFNLRSKNNSQTVITHVMTVSLIDFSNNLHQALDSLFQKIDVA